MERWNWRVYGEGMNKMRPSHSHTGNHYVVFELEAEKDNWAHQKQKKPIS